MTTEIEEAIKKLAKKSQDESEAGKAMQFAQSALNLAHVLATLDNITEKN